MNHFAKVSIPENIIVRRDFLCLLISYKQKIGGIPVLAPPKVVPPKLSTHTVVLSHISGAESFFCQNPNSTKTQLNLNQA